MVLKYLWGLVRPRPQGAGVEKLQCVDARRQMEAEVNPPGFHLQQNKW